MNTLSPSPIVPVQTAVAGLTTGSLVNYVQGNNQTRPVAGEGATLLLWSDRHAYKVISVSDDGLKATIQRYDAKRTDSNGQSEDQTYDLTELTDFVREIEYRKKGWCFVNKFNEFTKEYSAWIEANQKEFDANKALKVELWGEDMYGSLKLVPGKTKPKTTYSKISILFGDAQEYSDPTF